MNYLKIFTTAAFIGISVSLYSATVITNDEAQATRNSRLVLTGLVHSKNTAIEGAVLTLFRGSTEVYSCESKNNGKFKLELALEEYYILEVHSKGYLVKRIIFSTDLPPNVDRQEFSFKFRINLIAEEDMKWVDTSQLDLPVALITYDQASESFSHNTKYSMDMKLQERKLLKDSQLRQQFVLGQ